MVEQESSAESLPSLPEIMELFRFGEWVVEDVLAKNPTEVLNIDSERIEFVGTQDPDDGEIKRLFMVLKTEGGAERYVSFSTSEGFGGDQFDVVVSRNYVPSFCFSENGGKGFIEELNLEGAFMFLRADYGEDQGEDLSYVNPADYGMNALSRARICQIFRQLRLMKEHSMLGNRYEAYLEVRQKRFDATIDQMKSSVPSQSDAA